MKGEKIDIGDLWERAMFEERKINTTARKIIATPGSMPGQVYKCKRSS